MKKITTNTALLFLVCMVLIESGGAKRSNILRRAVFTFENKNCQKTRSCSLKRVKYIVEDYKDGNAYRTRFFAQYETDRVSALRDYVFVQLLRGCAYATELDIKPVVPGDDEYAEEEIHLGERVAYHFRRWAIDSDWADPVYSSEKGQSSRHFLSYWNVLRGSTAPETQRSYAQGPPPFPELYIYDRPGSPVGAAVKDGFAHNVSLQFRTCIYKTRDVPTKTVSGNIRFAEPISCYDWDSSFIYNRAAKKFERHAKISPACGRFVEGPPPLGP